jgi:prepilin-type N-terminal cleavage/methylation domain-containing protein
MQLMTAMLSSPRVAAPQSTKTEAGFSLIEVMVCTLILTTGMLGIAGLLGVTTTMQFSAREAARSTRLAQEKIDELMKLDFDTAAAVAVGGSTTANVANHFEQPIDGVTVRWQVANGPVADTRLLTVRVQNLRAQQYGRRIELTTIIREW